MNIRLGFTLALVLLCAECVNGLRFCRADEVAPAPVPAVESVATKATSSNTVTPTHVSIKASSPNVTSSILTYHIKVADHTQPIVLHVGTVNALDTVVAQLIPILRRTDPNARVHLIAGTAATDKKPEIPHAIELTFSKEVTFDPILFENSITIVPQYFIRKEEPDTGVTWVRSGIYMTNKSPYDWGKVSLDFQGGGMMVKMEDFKLEKDEACQIDTTIDPEAKDSKPADQPRPFPLAFWATPSDFSKGKGKAVLRFPMKKNWPEVFTLPGPIHAHYEGYDLISFIPDPSDLANSFKATINEELHSFPPKPGDSTVVNLLSVDMKAESENSIKSVEHWPQVEYDEITDYSSTDMSGKPVWMRVSGESKNLTSAGTPIKVSESSSKSNAIVVVPGQDPGKSMEQILMFLKGLTAREVSPLPNESQRKELLKKITLIIDVLDHTSPVAQKVSKQLAELKDRIETERKKSPGQDISKELRDKYNHVSQALSSLVDSYNAWVLSQPW